MAQAPKQQISGVGELIDKWFKDKNIHQKKKNFDVFHNWEKIVGKTIAKNTKPTKFYKDVLVINVRNSVWTQELQFMKPELLEKIKESFPETKIRDLMFKVAPV